MIRGAYTPSLRVQTAPFGRCWQEIVKPFEFAMDFQWVWKCIQKTNWFKTSEMSRPGTYRLVVGNEVCLQPQDARMWQLLDFVSGSVDLICSSYRRNLITNKWSYEIRTLEHCKLFLCTVVMTTTNKKLGANKFNCWGTIGDYRLGITTLGSCKMVKSTC